jgi:ribosomal protein L4
MSRIAAAVSPSNAKSQHETLPQKESWMSLARAVSAKGKQSRAIIFASSDGRKAGCLTSFQ